MKPDGRKQMGLVKDLNKVIARATNTPSAKILQEFLASHEFQGIPNLGFLVVTGKNGG